MNIIDAVILGIVEGLTEFLPVSSTGHLILASRLLGLEETEFLKSFDISIQLGAILAVVALYWRMLARDRAALGRVAAAFVPTGVIGLLFYKFVKTYLLGNFQVVLWALALGGLALIVFERFHAEKADAVAEIGRMSYRQALIIGTAQSLAMVPGVSRSAATIVGGLALGLKRKTIVEFSFLLAVPTMAAAAGLDLLKSGGGFTAQEMPLLAAGFAVSFVVALASVRFLLGFIKTRTFVPFGVYRLAVAAAFWYALTLPS